MARALLGYVGNNSQFILEAEVSRLRSRIAELEAEVRELRDQTRVEIDLELHRFAEDNAPALT